MRNFFILFVLCFGLMSMTEVTSSKEADQNLLEKTVLDFEIDEDFFYECSVFVQNSSGAVVATITAIGNTQEDACENARATARLWVASQGN